MMISHASRIDLDNWEKLGNPEWNFETLQPYYRKSETFNAPHAETAKELGTDIIDASLHGTSGPLQSNFAKGQGPLDQAWGSTFKTLGLGPQADPRAGNTLGGYSLPKYMDGSAKRSYATPAYYVPSSGRSNLTVLTGAFVKNIAFDTNSSPATATGVWFSAGGNDHFVGALKEVILSAGTVKSPQILELSGIGNKTQLDNFGIDVVVDNPGVGENLQVNLLCGFEIEMPANTGKGPSSRRIFLRSSRRRSHERNDQATWCSRLGFPGIHPERGRTTRRWCDRNRVSLLCLCFASRAKSNLRSRPFETRRPVFQHLNWRFTQTAGATERNALRRPRSRYSI